jgi:hypothetical protein
MRSGRIIEIRQDFLDTPSGPAGNSSNQLNVNYVLIEHDQDGKHSSGKFYRSLYLHLQHNSVRFLVGDHVYPGDVIANSGNIFLTMTQSDRLSSIYIKLIRNIMTQETVNLKISFESLVNAIASLGLEEQRKLWQILDEQIAEAEDKLLEEDPNAQAEIEETRTAYQVGDYLTLDEYIAQQSGNDA